MSNYVTSEEAATYFAGRLNTEAWDQATSSDRTKAITMSTRIIDTLNYEGSKHDSAQTNQFPRGDDTDVPQDIEDACCEITLALLDGVDPDKEFEDLGVVSHNLGTVKSTYDRSKPPEHILFGIPSVAAWRLLKPYTRRPTTVDVHRVS